MNTPRNYPWQKKRSINSKVADMIFAVLEAIKNKPENKWKDEFEILKDFLQFYSIDWNNGLLEEISKIGNISLEDIKDDWFSVDQIIWDDRNTSSSTLHNILHNPHFGNLWADIEKVAIQKLVESVKAKVPNNLQGNFDKKVNSPKTLNEFNNQIWNFLEFGWVDDSMKEDIKKVKITHKEIVDWLVKDWKISANDIDWNYKNRNASQKKTFDKFVTQGYLDWLRNNVNYVEKTIDTLKNTFTNFIPNMWWIMDKYPWNDNEIDQEILEKIDEAQENGDKEASDKLSFYAYIELVQNKNNTLWNILSKLFQNKFDFAKLDKREQNELIKEMVNGRLEELKKSWIAWLLEIDQNDFDNFVRDIFDLEKNEIKIWSAEWDIKLWVNKSLKWWENSNMTDLSVFSETQLPINLDIKILDENKDIINNNAIKDIFKNEISADWKSINLDPNNIWKLLLLYVLWERSFDKKNMSKEKVDKLEKEFEILNKKNQLDNPHKNLDKEDKEKDINDENWKEKGKESIEKENDPFMEKWKSIKWYQFPDDKENHWFVEWSELWIKRWDTELPPKDIWWDQWIKLKIQKINKNSFTFKLSWWELSAGGMEWKTFTYPKIIKDEKTGKIIIPLEGLINSFNWDIYKLPPGKEWDKTLWNIKAWWLENLDWWIWIFDDIEIKSWKFVSRTIEWNPQITHFWWVETTLDKNDLEQKESINYEVKFNNNWTVDVKFKDYKRTMDYNNFIIFVSTKRLKAKTKEEAEMEIQNNPNPWTWKKTWFNLKFFSLNNIINFWKKIGKNIWDWIKKYNEKQDKKLFNKMVWDRRIANKLQSVIWRIPWVWWALESMDSEYQNNMDKETWEKTEAILKVIEWHNDFGAIFDEKTYMNHLLWWQSFKDMILSWNIPWWLDENNDKRFVASAILLAIIKKWPWPYFKMWSKRYEWIWVKLLLWEPYYTRFMNAQKTLIEEMKAKQWLYGPGYDSQMATELARSEMTFLINNIWWRAQWQLLGVNTVPNEKWKPDGDTRPKKIRSDAFASELETRFNDFISRDKIKEWSDKLWNVNNFTFAYWEYKRLLTSDRPTKALPFLERMWDLAKSPEQIKKFIWAISYGMLTGFFLHHATPATQTWIQTKCRTFWFTPWMRANHIDQQKKLAYFFSKVQWKTPFSKTKYNLSDFEFWKEIKNILGFVWEFERRRNDNYSEVCNTIKNKIWDNDDTDPIFAQLKKASMEEQQEDIDENISKNSKLMSQFPLQQTKWTIKKISNYDNWSFRWNVDEVQRSQDVWNAISKEVKLNSSKKWQLIFNTQRLLNWFDEVFDETWKADFVKTLYTIKKYKWLMSWWKYTQHYWNIPIWNIYSKDIENMLRYNFNWKIFGRWTPPPEFSNAISAFASMFLNNIDQIDNDFIKNSFGEKYVEDFSKDKSYQLIPWELYFRLRDFETNQLEPREKEFKKKFWSLKRTDLYINEDMYDSYRRLKWRMACPPLWWDRTQYVWIEWMK